MKKYDMTTHINTVLDGMYDLAGWARRNGHPDVAHAMNAAYVKLAEMRDEMAGKREG